MEVRKYEYKKLSIWVMDVTQMGNNNLFIYAWGYLLVVVVMSMEHPIKQMIEKMSNEELVELLRVEAL